MVEQKMRLDFYFIIQQLSNNKIHKLFIYNIKITKKLDTPVIYIIFKYIIKNGITKIETNN